MDDYGDYGSKQHQILLVGGKFNQFNVEWYGTCHG